MVGELTARIPAPVWTTMPADGADEASIAAWAEAEALAMVRSEGYIGLRADRLLRRGWPVEAVDWSLATFPATTAARRRALDDAVSLATDPAAFEARTGRAGLGFGGNPGRGKTGLAAAIGAALVEGGSDVTFARWGAVADEAFSAVGTRGAGVADVTARLADAEVLILDDLGEAGATSQPEFLRRVVREIVWPRYERRAITLVTTNLPEAELAAQFGEATLSRLAGMLRWVALDGDDERRKDVGR